MYVTWSNYCMMRRMNVDCTPLDVRWLVVRIQDMTEVLFHLPEWFLDLKFDFVRRFLKLGSNDIEIDWNGKVATGVDWQDSFLWIQIYCSTSPLLFASHSLSRSLIQIISNFGWLDNIEYQIISVLLNVSWMEMCCGILVTLPYLSICQEPPTDISS